MEHLVYTTVAKSSWPRGGPWDAEPDKEQWPDEATGFACLLKRHPSLGSLCGYVGVPEGHPWFGLDYDEVPDAAHHAAHGGLTYAAPCAEGGDEATSICHIPGPGEPDRVWWLGFDAGHAGDLLPGHRYVTHLGATDVYRTAEYMRGRCRELAAAAAAAAQLTAPGTGPAAGAGGAPRPARPR